MTKLIFLDIDGTLRDERFGIPASVKTAIELCKENEHIVAICTGRSVGTIQDDVLDLHIETIIAGGGSYISHKGYILKRECFDEETITEFQHNFLRGRKNIAYSLESEDIIFMNWNAANILNEMNMQKSLMLTNEQKQYFIRNQKIIYEDNSFLFDAKKHKIHKICLWCTPAEFSSAETIIGEENMTLVQEGRWKEEHYYEILKKGCNKGDAIRELCQYLNIDGKNTIAFGDGKNDIDMLVNSGTAIAMKNSAAELLPFADSICEPPMKDGIYRELKRRNLI